MSYKYYTSSSPVDFESSKDGYLYEFQSFLDENFKLSPTYTTIKEEVVFGSGSFVDVNVRVTTALNSSTGEKLGDDFKNVLFGDIDHATGLGYKYFFDSNYWVVVFSEIIKNIGASAMIRRCNNVLRWIDENGKLYSEPVALEYEVSRPRDASSATNPVIPQGYVSAYCQLNDRTKKIKPNQRFLFGPASNRVSFKVFGTGLRNFLNQQTMDDESANLLQLTMGGNFENEDSDNLVLGIANYYKYVYSLSLSPSAISGSAGNSYQIYPTLTLNGTQVSKPLNFISSSSSVVTNGSGFITLVASGSAKITGYMVDNTSASASVNVSVLTSPVGYEVRITPLPTQILEGDSQSYFCYLYDGGILQSDVFTFTAGSSVPVANYSLSALSGNSFSVENIKRYLTEPLSITCSSGSYLRNVYIDLCGMW